MWKPVLSNAPWEALPPPQQEGTFDPFSQLKEVDPQWGLLDSAVFPWKVSCWAKRPKTELRIRWSRTDLLRILPTSHPTPSPATPTLPKLASYTEESCFWTPISSTINFCPYVSLCLPVLLLLVPFPCQRFFLQRDQNGLQGFSCLLPLQPSRTNYKTVFKSRKTEIWRCFKQQEGCAVNKSTVILFISLVDCQWSFSVAPYPTHWSCCLKLSPHELWSWLMYKPMQVYPLNAMQWDSLPGKWLEDGSLRLFSLCNTSGFVSFYSIKNKLFKGIMYCILACKGACSWLSAGKFPEAQGRGRATPRPLNP